MIRRALLELETISNVQDSTPNAQRPTRNAEFRRTRDEALWKTAVPGCHGKQASQPVPFDKRDTFCRDRQNACLRCHLERSEGSLKRPIDHARRVSLFYIVISHSIRFSTLLIKALAACPVISILCARSDNETPKPPRSLAVPPELHCRFNKYSKPLQMHLR